MPSQKKNRIKAKKAALPSELPPSTMTEDDDVLMNDLLAQLNSRDHHVQQQSAAILNEMNLGAEAEKVEAKPKQDAKSRFKARQARKAAQLAQTYSPDDPEAQRRLEKEAQDEAAAIQKVCDALSLRVHEINPDGHCLYSAVADQLALLGVIPPSQASYANLRNTAANFIHSHPDDFIPFLPSSLGEDTAEAFDAGIMDKKQFDDYCYAIRDSAVWGGEPEIVALSRAYSVPIHIVQGGEPPVVKHQPGDHSSNNPPVWISYHRRLYGLGEHYNSLRPNPA